MKVVANIEYTKVQRIGVGQGMNSEVYLADDPQLGGRIAVKEIAKANFGNNVAAFFAEAQTMFSAAHDNVVPVQYACATKDHVCIAMPYYAAGSLQDRIDAQPLSMAEVIRVGDAVLNGLAQIHMNSFIHFDVKPSNVLFGRHDTPLVADFGQSRRIGPKGIVQVPPLYFHIMPPECMLGGVGSSACDIYQAGILLYRCVNGDPFFKQQVPNTDAELQARTVAGTYPDRDSFLPHVPLRLRKLIRKALEVAPQDRYQSATEMADDLAQVPVGLNWSVAHAGASTTWTAARGQAPGYEVVMAEKGGRHEVRVHTVASDGSRRAKGKDDLWAADLRRQRALTHLRRVFRALEG